MSQVGTGTWKNLIWKVKNVIWKNLNSGFTKTVKLYNLSLHVYKMGVLRAVINRSVQFSSVAVVSNSLRPHELQHARPPCPSPTPGVHPDSRPLSQ